MRGGDIYWRGRGCVIGISGCLYEVEVGGGGGGKGEGKRGGGYFFN